MRSAFHVDTPGGDRWLIALDMIRSGGGLVALGDRLLLSRDAAGPRASGRVIVEILASASQDSLTLARASSDIAAGLAALRDIESDLGPVSSVHGLDCAYVVDRETTRVALASIADDGSIEWVSGSAPRI